MTSDYKLSVILVEDHLRNVRVKDVLDDSDRFTCAGVPNFDVPLACHEDLKTFLAEKGSTDCLVICVVVNEGPLILEDCEGSSSADQSTMLGDCPDALNLIGVLHIEGLHAAIVEDVPHLDHSFEIGSDETVQIRQTVDSD